MNRRQLHNKTFEALCQRVGLPAGGLFPCTISYTELFALANLAYQHGLDVEVTKTTFKKEPKNDPSIA